MKLEKCKDCYYAGIKKCFIHEKKYEEIENCNEYLKDPYMCGGIGEYCQSCWFYKTNQCLGNEIAKEQCLMEN